MSTIIVANTDAGQYPKYETELKLFAKEHAIELQLVSGDEIGKTIEQVVKNYDTTRLIVGGGDGTVRLAAGLIAAHNPTIELGVLPLGTANYYPKSLGYDKDLKRSFTIATGKNLAQRHICQANEQYFLIGMNVGRTSHMFAEVTSQEKQQYGKAAYIIGLLRALRQRESPNLKITIAGQDMHIKSAELLILNQSVDDRVPLTPEVAAEDPYFELINYGIGASRLSAVWAMLLFMASLGRNQRYLSRIRSRHARITSTVTQPYALDGDAAGELPVDVRVCESPINFLVAGKNRVE